MPHWFALFTLRYWSAKRAALLVGFLLTIAGSLGTQIFVAPYQSAASKLDLQAKDLSTRIDVLKTAQAQYILFQQQGALIFAISAAGISTGTPEGAKMISQLFQLNMLDRMEAIQTIIGSLALAQKLDYRSTYDRYKALVDTARKTISLADYTAVDDEEKKLTREATSQIGSFQDVLSSTQQAKGQADAAANRNQLFLLLAMTLGSAFLLAANLISSREAPAAKASIVTEPSQSELSDEKVAELTTAAYLIEVALERARNLGDRKADV